MPEEPFIGRDTKNSPSARERRLAEERRRKLMEEVDREKVPFKVTYRDENG
jgi:hypothetical protein